MIPAIPINLRRFEQVLCPTFCSKKSMRPLSCITNVNHIKFVVSWEKIKILQKNSKNKSYITMTLMKTPWYKRSQSKRVEEPLQKRPSWSRPPVDKTTIPQKIYRSHTNSRMLGSKRFSNRHLRTPDLKEIQKYPHEKFFYYPDPRAKDPLTNEKLSPLNRNERTKILTTFQTGG